MSKIAVTMPPQDGIRCADGGDAVEVAAASKEFHDPARCGWRPICNSVS